MRMFGVLMVMATGSIGLSFCVIPVLVAIWINDWRSLPQLLWRYEGKSGSPYNSKLDERQKTAGGGNKNGPDALSILLAPCYSINGVLPAFKFSRYTFFITLYITLYTLYTHTLTHPRSIYSLHS